MKITFKSKRPTHDDTQNLAQALRRLHLIRKSLHELALLNIGATIATQDSWNRECSKYVLVETELVHQLHVLHPELSMHDLLNWEVDPVSLIAEDGDE